MHTPYDGHVDPYSLTQAIAKGARMFVSSTKRQVLFYAFFRYGANIIQNLEVTSLTPKTNGQWIVGTNDGEIIADTVINAAGMITEIFKTYHAF